jgi:hypothetical protein
MSYTFLELKKKTVNDLREIAKGIQNIHGFTQMNKEHLLKEICTTLKIDMREHHVAVVMNKTQIKNQIKILKKKRAEVTAARDATQLRFTLDAIHRLKRKLHKAVI